MNLDLNFDLESNIKKINTNDTAKLLESKLSTFPGLAVVSKANPEVKLDISDETTIIREYWKAISICHECQCETDKNGNISYNV
jgi:hypothetical protein